MGISYFCCFHFGHLSLSGCVLAARIKIIISLFDMSKCDLLLFIFSIILFYAYHISMLFLGEIGV